MYGTAPYGTTPYGANSAPPATGNSYLELLTSGADAGDELGAGAFLRYLTDSASATELITSFATATLRDVAAASVLFTSGASFIRSLSDAASASDLLVNAIYGVLEDSADADVTLVDIHKQYNRLRDIALALDATSSSITASNTLLSLAVGAELLRVSYSSYLTDEAEATHIVINALRAAASLVDEAEAEVSVANTLSVVGLLSDGAESTDALTSVASLLGALSSGAAAAIVVRIGGQEFTAWVLNTENIAVSQYDNYQFNSYTKADNTYYGAASDGIYKLDGDDDQGAAIKAYFRVPLTDFGFASLKRLPELYIGYTSSGDLVFKMIPISQTGVKEEHWYRLKPRTAEGTRESVVPVGKGLKSVYWQYEVENINGADFQVETTRLWPMGLTRRVR